MNPFEGPQAGDMCVGCIHKPDPDACHYFYAPELEFAPPGGKLMKAKWILLCHVCHAEYGGDIDANVNSGRLKIGCHQVWPKGKTVQFFPGAGQA